MMLVLSFEGSPGTQSGRQGGDDTSVDPKQRLWTGAVMAVTASELVKDFETSQS
jgi:hypothetical protein